MKFKIFNEYCIDNPNETELINSRDYCENKQTCQGIWVQGGLVFILKKQ